MGLARSASLVVSISLVGYVHATDTGPRDGLFSPDAAAIVKTPTAVKAWRLAEGSTYRANVSDYQLVGEAVKVDAATAKVLADVLLESRSYVPDQGKACDPLYGVRIQFQRNDESVDMVFCFQCDIVTVYFRGKETASEDFDPSHASLVALMKRIFAEDRDI